MGVSAGNAGFYGPSRKTFRRTGGDTSRNKEEAGSWKHQVKRQRRQKLPQVHDTESPPCSM